MKNPAGKTRKVAQPYASWTDSRTGWKYKLLKSWQGDNGLTHARWFVDVQGFGHDMGDEYVYNLRTSLRYASDLVVDVTVWENIQSFKEWVK